MRWGPWFVIMYLLPPPPQRRGDAEEQGSTVLKLEEIKVGDRIEGLETSSRPIEQREICREDAERLKSG